MTVKTDDLLGEVRLLQAKLVSITEEGSSGASENQVWQVYASTEKVIAFLKFRIGYESPRGFTELPKPSKDPHELLTEAAKYLSEGEESISKQRLIEGLELLRQARNHLRSYLTEKKKTAIREQRERRKRPTSSPSTS